MPANTLYRKNIFSEELLKTLYIEPGLSFSKVLDSSVSAAEKDTLYYQRNGVRCNPLSPVSCLPPPVSYLLYHASCLLSPPISCLLYRGATGH